MHAFPLRLGAALRGLCPSCGGTSVFSGFLDLHPACPACGADFRDADSGDGPAFFVMFLVAILVTPPVILVQVWLEPPAWVQMLIWAPVVLGLSVAFLRPFKSTLFALQWRYRAEEARWDDRGPGS